MLTIKKVETVVSNYQEEVSDGSMAGCGQNCLGNCCFPASRLPLYEFKIDNSTKDVSARSPDIQPESCFLHNLLLGGWEDRMNRGLFRYDVSNCESKIIPGQYGFIAQLNEGRHMKKRPTELRVDCVLQDFDHNKFNFTKVGQEEVLFMFEPSGDHQSHYYPTAPITAHIKSPNVVAINVSPIEYGHVLLIPRVLDCLPQRIDYYSLLLALRFATEAADPFFRLGYNSLGAFASINHLHFQAYYLAVPFPIEKSQTRRIETVKNVEDRGVIFSELINYPLRGFVFEGGHTTQDLSASVARCCISLQNNNFPFNLLISDCGKRVFLLPQCYAEKQALGEVSKELVETQVNPACWEISGHMVLKRKIDFDEASEACACRLLSEVSLSQERFHDIRTYVLEAAGFQEMNLEENTRLQEDGSMWKNSSPKSVTRLREDFMLTNC